MKISTDNEENRRWKRLLSHGVTKSVLSFPTERTTIREVTTFELFLKISAKLEERGINFRKRKIKFGGFSAQLYFFIKRESSAKIISQKQICSLFAAFSEN